MTISLLGSFAGSVLGLLMGFLSLFLILLILIQKGKGGGLTGALGGPGGQSAFGSKAGDTFTVITIVVASIWGFTCAFTMWLLGTHTPTTVTETNMTAGPGDDDETSPGNELIIPPASSGLGGLGGIGPADSTETPSADLVPASPDPETSESADADADPAADGESLEGDGASENQTGDGSSSDDASSPENDSDNPDDPGQ